MGESAQRVANGLHPLSVLQQVQRLTYMGAIYKVVGEKHAEKERALTARCKSIPLDPQHQRQKVPAIILSSTAAEYKMLET